MKGQLKGLILKGESKEDVDKYIEKGRKMAEKKTVQSPKQMTKKDEANAGRLKELYEELEHYKKEAQKSSFFNVNVNKTQAKIDKLLGKTPTTQTVKQTFSKSPEEKRVIDEARSDWNNQCKLYMSGNVPFRDKTSKACYERHARAAGL